MELSFAQQSAAFLWSVALGASLAVLYGIFKFIRFSFSPGKAAVFLLDVLFMLSAAVSCFLFSLGFIQGYVRFYVFIGAAIGFAAYRMTVGRLTFILYSRFVLVCRKILNKILRKLKLFAKKLLKICHKILYNVGNRKVTVQHFDDKGNEYGIEKEKEAPAEGPKEVEPVKKKRKLRYLLLYVAAIGFAFYAVITIINQNVRIAEKRAELSELQQQINVVEIQSKYIEKVRGYKGQELSDYMEKIAKEELGYVGEGERIFINVAGDQ